MSKYKPNKVVAAAVATALSIPAINVQNLLAQDSSNIALEEIIVTATKRELNLQDVGQAIMVLSNADIEKMGIKSMADYVKALPSVVLTAERPGQNDLVMRGITQDAYTWYVDSIVALYLDEQPMTTSSQQVGVRAIDIQRIEALAGPQGTLFGSTSQSGTLRMITNKPDHSGNYGQVETSYGTIKNGDSSFDVNGYVNIPLVDDVLSMRAVGYTSSDGGYVDNVLGSSFSGSYDNSAIVEDDFNTYDVTGGRVALLWNISEDWSALLSHVTEQSELLGSWDTDPSLGDYKITRFIKEMRDDDWQSSALTLKGDLGFADLSATVTTYDRDIVYEWDNHSYTQWKDAYYGYGLYDTGYTIALTFNDQYQERQAAEVRLVSKGESQLQWMVGGYWEDVYDEWYYGTEHPDYMSTNAAYYANYWACYYASSYDFVSCPINTTFSYTDTYSRSVEQTALFGEFNYDVTDQLTLGAGIRWSEFERETSNRDAFPEGLPPFAGGGIEANGSMYSKGKSDDTLYKLSATYNIDDDKMVYALFSQGFRIGGVNSPRAAKTGEVGETFDADYMDNYEIGLKSNWQDNRLRVNAQYFIMKWSDMQIAHWGGVGPWWVGGTVNAETAESAGLEIDIEYQIAENIHLKGSAIFTDAKFTKEYVSPAGSVYRNDMIMPNSPDRKGYFGISYDKPDVAGGDLWVYYGFSFQSESWNRLGNIIDNDTNGISPSHNNSNFSIGLDNLSNGWNISLYIDNVFDDATYSFVNTNANNYADLFGAGTQRNVRSLAQPRTTWLTARKTFGR
ncbi:MAG: TonB-dependent receptor [Woeseiaceae bacterium]|nr:TonB-dependent receptor [Woeseiaceae bacterium]